MRDTLQIDTRRAVLFIAVLCALLYVNWVFTVARFQPNVMYWDQWEIFQPLFQGAGWWVRFMHQNGPVREGLGLVITGWILDATQWDVRYDSLWGASTLLLAAVLAVRLKWKMTGAIGLRDAWIPLLCLSPGQFETVLVVGQPAHSVLPFALIVLAANIWLSPTPIVKYLVGAVVVVMLTFTGFGLFAGAALTVLLVTRACRHALEGERRLMWLAVAGIALSAAGWVVFRRDYVFNPSLGNFTWWWMPWTDYVRFILRMLGRPLAAVGQEQLPYLAGSVLALVVVGAALRIAWVWLRDRASPRNDVLVLLMGSGLLFVAVTVTGRVSLGPVAGTAPRYLTLMIPMWLAAYLAAAMSGKRRVGLAAIAGVWVLAALPYLSVLQRPPAEWPGTVGLTQADLASILHYGTNKAAWVDVEVATGSWEAAQEAQRQFLHSNPEGTHMDDKIRFMRERKLSFFAGEPERGDYMPWLADENFRRLVAGQKKGGGEE